MSAGAERPIAGGFVGRDRELATLARFWHDARHGFGRLVLVGGEAGIGKTRLVRELAGMVAEHSPDAVAWGRCREEGGAPAYWPWIEVLGTLRAEPDAPELAETVAADIATLLGASRQPELPTARQPQDAAAAASARFRLRDSVVRAIEAAARLRPRLVVLDDLHCADGPTLELLDHLTVELVHLPVLITGTYRDLEVPAQHPLRSHRGGLREAVRLPLGGLETIDAARLAVGFLGPERPEPDVSALVDRAGGNPLFVQELALLAGAEGHAGTDSLPASLVEVVLARLAVLDADTQHLLRLASVPGRDLDPGLLARALDLEPAALAVALDTAVAARLVEERPRLRFVHAVVQEAIYTSLPLTARLDGHELFARALEADPRTSSAALADLARHAVVLVRGGRSPERARWALRAARDALDRLAHADAVRWARTALELTEHTAGAPAEQFDAQLAMGDALACVGDMRAARDAFEAAAALARTSGDRHRFAAAVLGVGRTVISAGTVDLGLVALLEEAMVDAPEDEAPRLLARLAIEWYWHADSARARELSAEALRLAERRPEDRHGLAAALHARLFTLRGPSDPTERLAVGARLIAAARDAEDDELDFAGRTFVAPELIQTGDLAAFRRELGDLAARATRSRLPQQLWFAEIHAGCLAILEGRVDDALASIDEAARLATLIGARVNAGYRVGQLVALHRDAAGLTGLLDDARQAAAAFPYFRTLDCDLALVLVETGHLEEGSALVERLVTDRAAAIPPDSLWLASLAIATEAAALTGDTGQLRTLYDLLLPHAGRFSVQGIPCSWGSTDRQLGIAALGLDRLEAAETHLRAALAASIAARARPFVIRTRLDLARLAARDGRPAEAASGAAAAAREAEQLGLRALAATARAEARAVGADEASGSSAPWDDVTTLSRREREVVTLLASGATNKEIAARLYLSVNTVERHLANSYAKLGVRSRSEAVAWALRHHLG